MAKKKFYAVASGKQKDIFNDWASCEKYVKGVAGAKYKSFRTKDDAEAWLDNPQYTSSPKKQSKKKIQEVYSVDSDSVVIFTDGSSINNPGPGGYGIVIVNNDDVQEISGGFRHTTNNRMEMIAALVALRAVSKNQKAITLYSDSSYLVNGIEKGWAKNWCQRGWKKSNGEPALNADLWAEIFEITQHQTVQFRWLKGHAGNPLNERCDTLAVAAARNSPVEIDSGYEQTEKP